MASRLRPRSVSELVDVEFELLRRHYLSFLTIVAAGFAPLILIGVGAGMAGGLFGAKHGGSFAAPLVVVIGVAVVIALAFVAVLQGALVHAASDAYLEDTVNVADAFRRAATRAPSTLGAYVLMAGITFVGYVLLIVPGLLATAALCAVPAVVLLEGRGPGEAVGRSFALTKGRRWPVFGALFVAGLIAGAGRMTLNVAGALSGSTGVAIATQIVGFVALYPLTTIMAVLLYYDARIRVEGFDLERAAMALERAPAV